jgi:hypothetical protein
MLPNQITPDHLATPRLVASSSRRGSCCSAAASSPPRRPPPAVRRRSAWTWRSPPAAEYSPLALSPPASSSTPRSPSSATPLQRFSTRWPLLSSVAPPLPLLVEWTRMFWDQVCYSCLRRKQGGGRASSGGPYFCSDACREHAKVMTLPSISLTIVG